MFILGIVEQKSGRDIMIEREKGDQMFVPIIHEWFS